MKKCFYITLLVVLSAVTGCRSGDSGVIDVYGGSTDVADVPKHIADFKDDSNSGLIQARAMNALVKIGAPAVPPLITALEAEDSSTRLMALNTLNLIGPEAKKAIPAIEKLIKDKDADVQKRAADVLANLKKS